MSYVLRIARMATVMVCALSLVMAGMLAIGSTSSVANAGMVGTESVIEQQDAAAERERIEGLLEHEAVRAELAAYGVDPAEAKARVAALSDAEVIQLAGQLGDEPTGEGVAEVFGAVLIVAAILLLLDLFGLTNIFPFIRS